MFSKDNFKGFILGVYSTALVVDPVNAFAMNIDVENRVEYELNKKNVTV